MTVPTKCLDNELAKHNVTQQDVDFVLRSDISIWTAMTPSERGNDRIMFVGFDSNGRLLEVGIEYFDNENLEVVFHAASATPKYRKLFERIKP